jgi:hypothetical protein
MFWWVTRTSRLSKDAAARQEYHGGRETDAGSVRSEFPARVHGFRSRRIRLRDAVLPACAGREAAPHRSNMYISERRFGGSGEFRKPSSNCGAPFNWIRKHRWPTIPCPRRCRMPDVCPKRWILSARRRRSSRRTPRFRRCARVYSDRMGRNGGRGTGCPAHFGNHGRKATRRKDWSIRNDCPVALFGFFGSGGCRFIRMDFRDLPIASSTRIRLVFRRVLRRRPHIARRSISLLPRVPTCFWGRIRRP